jgi:CRISPR-associated endonuclease Csy4
MTPPAVELTHFVDFLVLPDPEFELTHLMSALFAKLHRALFDREQQQGICDLGVSFPEHEQARIKLGPLLRLHGTETALTAFISTPWLEGMRDHLRMPLAVQLVPSSCKTYVVVRRVQANSNPERLRRRLLKRNPEMKPETARSQIPDSAAEHLRLPFVQIRSRSTGQAYRLFVQHAPANGAAVLGHFTSYGMSQAGSTVPWF